MDDWDFDLFRDDLKRAVLKLHKDKASRVETYLDCEDKEYKVIIEEVEIIKKEAKREEEKRILNIVFKEIERCFIDEFKFNDKTKVWELSNNDITKLKIFIGEKTRS